MSKEGYAGLERRKCIRLDSVFPVSFQFLSLDGKQAVSGWLQGFTHDVSRGGLCLIANRLDHDWFIAVKNQKVKLALEIEMPLNAKPIAAQAQVCWVKAQAATPHKYVIGLSYERIDPYLNNKIIRYARFKKLFTPLALAIIIIISLGLALNSYVNIKLFKGNKILVEQLVKIVQDSSVAKQKIKAISKEKEDLQLKIQTLQLQIQNAEEERPDLKNKRGALIEKLTKNKISLQEQLIALQYQENAITEKLLRLDEAKRNIEKANFDQIYAWLKSCQNQHTGLVSSFNAKSDIINWAYLSEQSVVALAYTYFGDFERARKILEFFSKKAQRQQGLFFSAYSASEGSAVELAVDKSANIWLGIAVLQYTKESQDRRYLYLAKGIAKAIMHIDSSKNESDQVADLAPWQAGKDDLDSHVFYSMFYAITGKPIYESKAKEVFDYLIGSEWLAKHIWSILAIGPERLEEKGINPDRIIELTEQQYAAETSLLRASGKTMEVKGFDFKAEEGSIKDKARFTKDSAKMVLAYKIIGDFYHRKAMVAKSRAYKSKANDYLASLMNLTILDDPLSSAHSKSSLASKAYILFAYYNYNPLQFRE